MSVRGEVNPAFQHDVPEETSSTSSNERLDEKSTPIKDEETGLKLDPNGILKEIAPGYVESAEWQQQKKSSANSTTPTDSPTGLQSSTMTIKQEKFAILKNILIISIAFVFLFTAYNSMANLQSSINKEVGTASLSTLYAALVVSCFFLPSFLIDKLQEKKTVAFCMLGYSTYIAAQFYPEYYTLIPTAILLGLGAAPMWSAKCTYLTTVGERYANLIGVEKEVVITRFFGLFFLFFQTTQIWGNLIASLVLSTDKTEILPNDTNLVNCGRDFCPDSSEDDDSSSEDEEDTIGDTQRYVMATIYLVCALLSSVIILIFVDPLTKFKKDDEKKEKTSPFSLLIATFQHMKNPYQILIIPLTIWSGVEQAFIGSDFTAGYISCGYGVYMVGYIMILYGVCDSIVSFGFTPVIKYVGRIPVFVFGAICNAVMIALLLTWKPRPDENIELYFIVAGFWGIGDAIWQTQINAFYGVIFPGQSEAAFSNYRLWESVGFIIAYACSTLICIDTKIYILIGFLSTGVIGYLIIELLEHLRQNGKSIRFLTAR